MALSPERRAARQDRLAEVAQALIRERGDAGFSMTELALRAGVSPATPYNLLGSKGEILRRVITGDFARFTDRLAQLGVASPLDFLLAASDLAVTHYEADRQLHRGLLRAIFSADSGEARDVMSVEARSLWRRLVAAAFESGELQSAVGPDALSNLFIRVIGATAQTWSMDSWSPERFRLELGLAVRLILAAVVAPSRHDALMSEVNEIASSLNALRAITLRQDVVYPAFLS
jgi:AcrR family transcriptional regulator